MRRTRANPHRKSAERLAAFTLIELLVVLLVVGLLVGLVIAGVLRVREAARRMQCSQNLHQIGVAIQSYATAQGSLPMAHLPESGLSFLGSILPYEGQGPLLDLIASGGITTAQSVTVSNYLCPSDGSAPLFGGATNYAGNAGSGVQTFGYNGAFDTFGVVTPANFTDGMSTTACVSEWLVGPPDVLNRNPLRSVFHTPRSWMAPDELDLFASACRDLDPLTAELAPPRIGSLWTNGDMGHTLYTHVLPIGQHTCLNGSLHQEGAWTSKSLHPGGANLMFADGSARFVTSGISLAIWRALGSRAGGEVVGADY